MNEEPVKNPWDLVYEAYKDHYSREQIDEMLFNEVQELISEGKRPLYSEGYFTMVGNEILDKVNSMTLKKYQD